MKEEILKSLKISVGFNQNDAKTQCHYEISENLLYNVCGGIYEQDDRRPTNERKNLDGIDGVK